MKNCLIACFLALPGCAGATAESVEQQVHTALEAAQATAQAVCANPPDAKAVEVCAVAQEALAKALHVAEDVSK